MRILVRLVFIGALAALAACAPKTLSVPVVASPKFPDFVRPTVPEALASSGAVVNLDRAWAFLQAGDFNSAEREIDVALKTAPAFYPAEAGLDLRADTRAFFELFYGVSVDASQLDRLLGGAVAR